VRRLFFFIVKLTLVVAVAAWLASRPGTAHIVWHGYEIETSASILAVLLLAAAFVFYLLFRLWFLIAHGLQTWRLKRDLKHLKKGQEKLTEGLIAIASGDAAEAGRLAVGARKLLGATPLTRLLQAQAAQLAGDHGAAHEIFLMLAAEPQSAALGYRGLIMDAVRAKKWDAAEQLAEKLRRLKPETPWLNVIRFELAARRRQWSEAEAALAHITAARLRSSEQIRRHRAALLVAEAEEDARAGKSDKALEAAEHALRLAPGWTPAVLALAAQQAQTGHARAARHTIERAWKNAPHPFVAAAYRAGDDPLDAYKHSERLCRADPDAPLSHYVLAEAALDADLWGEARRHLMALMGSGAATQSAYRLLARLERRETGDENAAARWLLKAADASPDPTWLCRACGGAEQQWQALCPDCGAFDSMEWRAPGQSRMQGSGAGVQGSEAKPGDSLIPHSGLGSMTLLDPQSDDEDADIENREPDIGESFTPGR